MPRTRKEKKARPVGRKPKPKAKARKKKYIPTMEDDLLTTILSASLKEKDADEFFAVVEDEYDGNVVDALGDAIDGLLTEEEED